MTAPGDAIYLGHVIHQRMRPRRHRLRYGVFTLLLDVDGLAAAARRLRMLAYNRPGPFAIHDADHGDGRPIASWARAQLDAADLADAGHRVLMLCYPRILGYVFNPLSVFYGFRADGTLGAVIYEVHNTYGERHAYVLPAPEAERAVVRQHCPKAFHVSPFIPVEGGYDFRITPPGADVKVVIRQEDRDGLLLAASFRGDRRELSDAGLIGVAIRYPLMTVKVVASIHWEAFRLWLKGIPFIRYRARPSGVADRRPDNPRRVDA